MTPTRTPTDQRVLPGFVTPESMTAAAAYVRRDWGSRGYKMRHVSSWDGTDFYEINAGDGSTFTVSVSTLGRTQVVCESEDCMNGGTYRPFTRDGVYLCAQCALDSEPPRRAVPTFTRR